MKKTCPLTAIAAAEKPPIWMQFCQQRKKLFPINFAYLIWITGINYASQKNSEYVSTLGWFVGIFIPENLFYWKKSIKHLSSG